MRDRLYRKRAFRFITARLALCCFLGLAALLVGACSDGGQGDNTATPTPAVARVNGFGTAANHPHALLAFPNNVLVLATHYGTFWSGDAGANWKEVAGGPGQLMEGLMAYSLTSSSLNPQRVYELTQPAVNPHKGTLGLYASSDQGHSWQLASQADSLAPDKNIYLAAAGNNSADEVYVYIPALGATGLKVSRDAGQHFSATGTLPFGNLTSLLAIPGAKGQLLAGSSDGMARSSDSGQHWQVIKGISGGIFGGIVTAGPGKPIYTSGDEGVYASTDGGQSFTLANAGVAYGSLTVAPTEPQILYGRTGTGVYRSIDEGKNWKMLPHVAGNLFGLAADPNDAQQVYLSLSYPTEVYRFNQAGQQWQSLTPKP